MGVVARLLEMKAFHVIVLGGYALPLKQSVLFESHIIRDSLGDEDALCTMYYALCVFDIRAWSTP